jgi:hypothetical protein
MLGQITSALNNLLAATASWTPYLAAVTALGTLTMALLQVIKDTTPVRRWFQRYKMRNCLHQHAEIAKKRFHPLRVCATDAEKEILELAADEDEKAFYDLEIEKLCGQWNTAAQIVIDSPKLYPNSFACMAARVSKEDFERVKGRDLPEPLLPHMEVALSHDEQKERMKKRQDFLEARTRVAHQVQRTIDAFQISTSFRWKWILQLASFGISFTLLGIALAKDLNVAPGNAILSAAIAGFLAPIGRDLLASLQNLRSNS